MFQKALESAVTRLHKLRKHGAVRDFALIGGFAVARWGVPRATADIDFVFHQGTTPLETLAGELQGKLHRGGPRDPLVSAITFLEKSRAQSVPIQLLQFPPAWEEVAFEECVEEKFGRVILRTVGWKALVLLKLYAGSALDIEDAKRVLEVVKPNAKETALLFSRATRLRVSKRLERAMKRDGSADRE